MRVCLTCVELFAWGKYGGFGRATRMLGRELVKQGVEVFAVVPQRAGQQPEEILDGITVLAFPQSQPWKALQLYRQCNADIYHSQEASLGSYLAIRAAPDSKHLITFRDHKLFWDWLVELKYPSRSHLRTLLAWIYERNILVTRAIHSCDRLTVCSPHLTDIVRQRYKLQQPTLLLPTPVMVPAHHPRKSSDPTVCFLARWDKRKRPEHFLALAKEFPGVRFIAAGVGQNTAWDSALRRRFGHLPNLDMTGFINQFDTDALSTLLDESWILVNTSMREGLPTSFLEAMGHRCALLSRVNPDGVATRFGYHAKDDDFAAGLSSLLEGDAWRDKGKAGYRYIRDRFELGNVLNEHLQTYQTIIKADRLRPAKVDSYL
ncbi:MAG: glycosyltransferase family 4 protein [Gammaproteobacteria bacterium]